MLWLRYYGFIKTRYKDHYWKTLYRKLEREITKILTQFFYSTNILTFQNGIWMWKLSVLGLSNSSKYRTLHCLNFGPVAIVWRSNGGGGVRGYGYTNQITPLERRLCLVCHEIEDEIHFIMQCQLFETEPLDLFGRVGNKFSVFWALDETAKFISLMQNSAAQLITWVAKLMHHSMDKRNNIISEDHT